MFVTNILATIVITFYTNCTGIWHEPQEVATFTNGSTTIDVPVWKEHKVWEVWSNQSLKFTWEGKEYEVHGPKVKVGKLDTLETNKVEYPPQPPSMMRKQ